MPVQPMYFFDLLVGVKEMRYFDQLKSIAGGQSSSACGLFRCNIEKKPEKKTIKMK